MKVSITFFALVAGASCLFLSSERTSVVAQAKKGNDAQLQKKINDLQGDVRERDAKIKQLQAQLNAAKKDDVSDDAKIRDLTAKVQTLQTQLNAAKADDKGDDAKIKDLTKQLKDKDAKITQLQADVKKGGTPGAQATLIHSVIFKVKDGGDEKQAKKALDDASKTLLKIDGVRNLWFGKPSDKSATGAQSDYQFGLCVVLDDAAALDRLLADANYKNLQKKFDRPTIYDFGK